MNRITRARALLALTLLLAGTAAQGWAMMALPCADMISSGLNDQPITGYLWGTASASETRSGTVSGSPGGVGVSGTKTVTITYEIGTYLMDDGSFVELDCRTYTQV
jgi:hypothetical protein